ARRHHPDARHRAADGPGHAGRHQAAEEAGLPPGDRAAALRQEAQVGRQLPVALLSYSSRARAMQALWRIDQLVSVSSASYSSSAIGVARYSTLGGTVG